MSGGGRQARGEIQGGIVTTKLKGYRELLDEVIDAGLCTLCGACVGACPYLVAHKGRVVLLDNCNLAEGQCYQYCPRTYMDMDAISQQAFGLPYAGDELGTTREVLMARSTDACTRERTQYGGTVTTLLSVALAEGLVDAAILSRNEEDKPPGAFVARRVEEVLDCAGSNYMASPVLEGLNRIPRQSEERLALVATPCQALAVAKMKLNPPQNRVDIDNLKLTVGLFCTWALSPDRFHRFLRENLDLPRVVKFDIPPPPAERFDAYTASGRTSFPLDQIRSFVMSTCSFCLDMTAEFADVSVGSVEGIEGWNTVIVRTEAGAAIMERAKASGNLETAALPQENLDHLKEAALLKKVRALQQITERTGSRSDLLYLGLSAGVVDRLLG